MLGCVSFAYLLSLDRTTALSVSAYDEPENYDAAYDYVSALPLYREAGWLGVLPLPAGKKFPPPDGFTGRDGVWPSEEDFQRFTATYVAPANLALRLPPEIIGLDVDAYGEKRGAEELAELEAECGDLPETWVSTSREDGTSGIRLFRVDPAMAARMHDPGPGIEVVRYWHRYFVAWPSWHPRTNRQYEWHAPSWAETELPHLGQLPELPHAWQERLTQGKRPKKMSGVEPLSSLPVPPPLRQDVGQTYILDGGPTDHQLDGADVLVHGLDPYMRDESLFKAAGLLRDIGLDQDQARPLLEYLRDQCLNQEDMPSVEEKLRSAYSREPRHIGPSDLEEDIRREIRRLDVQAEARIRRAARETATSLTYLDDGPDLTEELALSDSQLPYTVARCFPAEGNVVLLAQYKAGKTHLLNNLALSLADGRPFLDQFQVTHSGAIALWNFEVGRDQYRAWLREIGIEKTHLVFPLTLRGQKLTLTSPQVQDRVARWLEERGIQTWCLDPFARALTGSENSNEDVLAFTEAVDTIKHKAGVKQVVLTAHTGRAHAEYGAERSRGATRLQDWADVNWVLTKLRREEDEAQPRFFRADEGRDVDVPEGRLEYDDRTRRMRYLGGSRSEATAIDYDARVLTYVREHPGAGADDIDKHAGGDEKKIRAARKRLVLGVAEAPAPMTQIRGARGRLAHYLRGQEVIDVHLPDLPDLPD